jgi:hypothetical protein
MTRSSVRKNAAGVPETEVKLIGNDHFEVRIPVEFDSWAPGTSFAVASWDTGVSVCGVAIPARRLRLEPRVADDEKNPTRFYSVFSFNLDIRAEALAEIERVRGLHPEAEVVIDLPIDIVYVDFDPNLPKIENSYDRLHAEVRWSRDHWLELAAPLLSGRRWVLEFAPPHDPAWKEVERHLQDAQRALINRDQFASRAVLSSCRAAWNSAKPKIGIHWNWQDAKKELPRQHALRTSGGYLSKDERIELIASTVDTLWNGARHFTETEAHREAGYDATWEDAMLAYRMTLVLLSYLSQNPLTKIPGQTRAQPQKVQTGGSGRGATGRGRTDNTTRAGKSGYKSPRR